MIIQRDWLILIEGRHNTHTKKEAEMQAFVDKLDHYLVSGIDATDSVGRLLCSVASDINKKHRGTDIQVSSNIFEMDKGRVSFSLSTLNEISSVAMYRVKRVVSSLNMVYDPNYPIF